MAEVVQAAYGTISSGFIPCEISRQLSPQVRVLGAAADNQSCRGPCITCVYPGCTQVTEEAYASRMHPTPCRLVSAQ